MPGVETVGTSKRRRVALISGPTRVHRIGELSADELFRKTGNTGNMAFRYAVHKHMGWEAPVFGWNTKGAKVSAAADVAVLPCANFVGPHAELAGRTSVLQELSIPVIAIGLGAQSGVSGSIPEVPPSTIQWVREIVHRAVSSEPNISLRGEYSQKVLDALGFEGKTQVLGCPSLFINESPTLGQTIEARWSKNPARVSVSAGNPSHIKYPVVEQYLAKLVSESDGSYIVQHPLQMVRCAHGELDQMPPGWIRKLRTFLTPDRDMKQFSQWAERHMKVFFDVEDWMVKASECDLMIGSRIHGTMLALQAGIPAICIAHDSRTLELCRFMGIPHTTIEQFASTLSLSETLEAVEFSGAEFDRRRATLARRYAEFLRRNQVEPPQFLQRLGETATCQ